MLIPACSALRESVDDLRVILAPHEPTERRLGQLRAAFLEAGWSPATLSDVEGQGDVGSADVILVDRVGVLAHLYTVGTVAYVGGGFHRHGLHSVLEPAAARIPVAFGPNHSNSAAAESLLERSGASEVFSPQELTRVLAEWLTVEVNLARAAEAAFGYIEEHTGAARRTVSALTEILGQSSS
jgi:3-deoxy-D-manno-octulosonic-acid transferase